MFFRASILLTLFVVSNGAAWANGGAQADSIAREWKLVATQNELIKLNKPYVQIDAVRNSMVLKLGNAIVWTMLEDSGTAELDLRDVASDFQPDSTLLFPVEMVRLMEYEPRFPDTLLKIVSEAMDMDPSLLQREIPVAFEIKWHGGPTLLVHSLPENEPVKIEVPFRQKLHYWLQSFRGSHHYEVQTNREIALTLYRVLKNGALTLVIR